MLREIKFSCFYVITGRVMKIDQRKTTKLRHNTRFINCLITRYLKQRQLELSSCWTNLLLRPYLSARLRLLGKPSGIERTILWDGTVVCKLWLLCILSRFDISHNLWTHCVFCYTHKILSRLLWLKHRGFLVKVKSFLSKFWKIKGNRIRGQDRLLIISFIWRTSNNR